MGSYSINCYLEKQERFLLLCFTHDIYDTKVAGKQVLVCPKNYKNEYVIFL